MKAAVIINPRSGRHGRRLTRAAELVALVRQLAQSAGRAIEIVEIAVTERAGHASDLSRLFVSRGADRVIAWGGDGTVNEVAGPLIGTRTSLGIVPGGSGDGLAGSLGLPRSREAAWRTALQAPARAIDVGFLGSRHFLSVAGIGFDAAAARTFNTRAMRGLAGYAAVVLPALRTYQCQRYRIELDGRAVEGSCFLIAFANGRQYGGGFVLADAADLRDGRLDAVIVDAGPAWRQIWRARRLAIGRRRPAHGISRTQVREATVTGDTLVCHVDGEPFETSGTLNVRVDPLAILVAGTA
jgi:diacylglycerol kinase (ATP)